MKFLIALVLALAASIHAKKEPPKQLQIGITKKVTDCTRKAAAGDRVAVHYTGTLFSDGTEFDSSVKRGTPFEFLLGRGQVIRGWDQGVAGMCVGEKRKLTIPSDLAYGERGSPPTIPENAALVFTVEMIEIKGDSPSPDAGFGFGDEL